MRDSVSGSPRSYTTIWGTILVNSDRIFCHPFNTRDVGTPIQQSNDVWASVVANVAPLMALVGERNAKEYMRTTSSSFQLLPISAAPIGMLAILVSAIRLSGPIFLKRLVGRDSERRSEVLVELTPLSVRPATSVYTSRAVEIETAYFKDRVAFICGHIRNLSCNDAAASFQRILSTRTNKQLEEDKDFEVVLAMWQYSLTIEDIASFADHLSGNPGETPTSFGNLSQASLSYRTTGISPSQTQTYAAGYLLSFAQLRDVIAFLFGIFLMIGVQVVGLKYGGSSIKTFWMGVAGYIGMVASTFSLLTIVKAETISEEEILPDSFNNSVWTFSNARHTEHKCMNRPTFNTLITARPAKFDPQERSRREIMTCVVCIALVGSYVIYYLSIRVAPWWVALSSLGVIWIGAAYRATASPNSIVAVSDHMDSSEYWIGIFEPTLSETLLKMIKIPCPRSALGDSQLSDSTTSDSTKGVRNLPLEKLDPVVQIQEVGAQGSNAFLLVVEPMRMGLNSWSGVEDVMKVALEMSKRVCRKKVITYKSHSLAPTSRWSDIVRFNISIYVPGMVWTSNYTTDFALPRGFSFDALIQLVVKLLHVSMDQEGTVTRHIIESQASVKVSHVLCGPIADPPVDSLPADSPQTLRTVLAALRDNVANAANERKFSLEQAILLPTISLACIFECLFQQGLVNSRIEVLQKSHTDNLRLSGINWLGALEDEFDMHGIWNGFMVDRDVTAGGAPTATELQPRDATSGDYATDNFLFEVVRESE